MLRSGLLIFFLFVAAAPAPDAGTGVIRGLVSISGGRISHASIAFVINNATEFRYITTSEAGRRFALDLLPPGEYSGSVEAQGMSPQVAESLHVEAGGGIASRVQASGRPTAVSAVGDERTVRSNQ